MRRKSNEKSDLSAFPALYMGFAMSSAAAATLVRQFQIEEALSAGILEFTIAGFRAFPNTIAMKRRYA